MKPLSGIYAIRNRHTGQTYIGKAENMKTRKMNHIRLLDSKSHHCQGLQASWIMWGESAFEWMSVVVCDVDCLAAYEHWSLSLIPVAMRFNSGVIKKREIPKRESTLARSTSEHAKWREIRGNPDPIPVRLMQIHEVRERILSVDPKRIVEDTCDNVSLATLYRIREGKGCSYKVLATLSMYFAEGATNGQV
jgi:hypothetical protein